MNRSSSDTVKQFFAAFGRGDLEAIVATFAPDATLVAVRPGPRTGSQIHGSYQGAAGVREFVANLGAAFETQSFAVDAVVGEGEVAFAKGSFVHRVKSTGKLFASEWALMCQVRAERITDYRFFEDSAAFAAATSPDVLSR